MKNMENEQCNPQDSVAVSSWALGSLAILTPLLILGAVFLSVWVTTLTDSHLAGIAVAVPIFGFTYGLGKHSRLAKAAAPDNDQAESQS